MVPGLRLLLIFLHSREIKFGSGLEMRLINCLMLTWRRGPGTVALLCEKKMQRWILYTKFHFFIILILLAYFLTCHSYIFLMFLFSCNKKGSNKYAIVYNNSRSFGAANLKFFIPTFSVELVNFILLKATGLPTMGWSYTHIFCPLDTYKHCI